PRPPLEQIGGGRTHGEGELGLLFVVLLAAAFAVYVLGLLLVRRGARFGAVFALACAIQLAPLAAPLLISTDAWTYWSYARLHDPYRQTPSEDPVSAPYAGAAYLHGTSVYGPAFSLVSKPVALTTSPDVAAWAFKTAAALCVLSATWLVARRRAFAAAVVGWNPVVAVHFAGGGHNDALMVALVAGALALGERGRPRWAGVAWSLAVLVKWVPLLLMPLRALEARATRRRVDHVGFAIATLVTLGVSAVLWRFHWLHALTPLARDAARETSYALPHRTGLPWWLFAAAYGVAYAWLLRTAARGRARSGLALALLLPALPYLIAWYVLWPLTVSASDDDGVAIVLTLALCAYLLPQRIPV
ncbi:MAG: alpha,6-mannosyltransferase, partial [Gaiellaceae bacterium]|nr:alpha,6-mannosyltransferase [Gaiellaceae bacterium]